MIGLNRCCIMVAMKKLILILILIITLIVLTGCTDYVKKEARGLKGSIDNAMMAVACVAIGQLPCVGVVVVKGYSEGVEAHDDKQMIKKAVVKDDKKKGWF